MVPPGPLLSQWDQELRHRFGLHFTPLTDIASLQAQKRRTELGVNPFQATSLCLTSLDFAKQERVLQDLERTRWDVAVIDEAHHCAADTSTVSQDSTLRRRLAEVVARQSDALLLLSATPHDGVEAHFASLMALLDPSLVDGSGALSGQAHRTHIVRRLKAHIRDPRTGRPLFRDRQVMPVRIVPEQACYAPARAFHHALAALVVPRLQARPRPDRDADALAFVGLLKRSVSTITACTATLRVVAERCARPAERAMTREHGRVLRAYQRRLRRFGFLGLAAEADLAELEAEGMAAQLRQEMAAELHRLIALGEAAASADPKLDQLVAEIAAIRRGRPAANVLVYTEYADSQEAAISALRQADLAGAVLGINGGDPENRRSHLTERFATEDALILVSTDAISEGLNLQRRCRDLIHLDLPYNPNRLEQRNGRIDRYGQREAPHIRYLYLAGTFEEDLLLRLITKHEAGRASLGAMPDTLGVTADVPSPGVVKGFAQRQAGLFPPHAAAIRTLDREIIDTNPAAYRALLRDVQHAYDERIALRFGWMPVQASAEDTAGLAQVTNAGNCHGFNIDPSAFVAEVIEADTGLRQARADRLRLNDAWSAGIEQLPGFDPETATLRLTRDPDKFVDGPDTLAFIGLAHPLLRHALARVQQIGPEEDEADPRVAVASSSRGVELLLTYVFEIRSARQVEVRQLLAVLLKRNAPAAELTDAHKWLAVARTATAHAPDRVWQQHFSGWAPARQAAARRMAEQAMRRAEKEFATAHQQRVARWKADLDRWVACQTEAICGPAGANMPDLFAGPRNAADWNQPVERLAALSTDAGAPPARRRDAASVVASAVEQRNILEQRASLARATLHSAGMLMLVP